MKKNVSANERLIMAVKDSYLEGVQEALENGANANLFYNESPGMRHTYHSYPLIAAAAKRNNAGIVELFLEHGAESISNALCEAANYGCIKSAESLLKHVGNLVESERLPKMDVNATDDKGYAPLHRASKNGDIEMMRLLLEKGANVNIMTDKDTTRNNRNEGQTALHFTSWSTCAQLRINGDEISDADANVMAEKAMELLLQQGANPDATNIIEGDGAIHQAAKILNINKVTILLNHGADVNLRNDRGETPLDVIIGEIDSIYDFKSHHRDLSVNKDFNKCLELGKLLIDRGASGNFNLENMSSNPSPERDRIIKQFRNYFDKISSKNSSTTTWSSSKERCSNEEDYIEHGFMGYRSDNRPTNTMLPNSSSVQKLSVPAYVEDKSF